MTAQVEMPWTAPKPPTPFPPQPPSPVLLRHRIEADITAERLEAKKRLYFERLAQIGAEENRYAPDQGPTRLEQIAYNLDVGFHQYPEEGENISDEDRAFAFSATGEYIALCKAQTGQRASSDFLAEMRKDKKTLLDQSFAIAEKMRLAGYDAFRETPFGLYHYSVHSGHVEKLPAFRRCMFIPYVAKQVRGPMLSALEYWLERHPFARFWTFSSGIRVQLSGVRDRAKDLHRRLSELNAQPFMRDAGARLVFRSTELGTPETNEHGHLISNAGAIEYDDDGQSYFHVHAHCVVELTKGPLHGQKWERLLKNVHGFWKHHWDDGGSVRGAQECCKYVTKPGEMLKLCGPDLVALQEQLSRLKLVHPMGSLAEEIQVREEKWLKLARKKTPDGYVHREFKNWNRQNRSTRDEGHALAAEKLLKQGDTEACRVVARLVPGIGPCGVSEPRVVIMATQWNEAAVRAHPFVKALVEHTRAEFLKGFAISVHTCTPTVGETGVLPFVRSLPPDRGRLTGAEMAGYSR